MKQRSLAVGGFDVGRKVTRRSVFLAQMNQVLPWSALLSLIEPFYAKTPTGAGRRPMGCERMLRIYFLQQWFALSDPLVEESLYDSHSMREFVGLDLGVESAPDETTILKFRHLLEQHNLAPALLACVNQHLAANGLRVSTGTIVDASIIHAPSSTKNQDKARDPEMKQTQKGNQYYFGMKAHVGMDSKTRLIHSVSATSANVHDSQVVTQLLHGNERRVYGDSAYAEQGAEIKTVAPQAKNFTQARAYRNRPLSGEQHASNRRKSKVRAKVEHGFQVMKCIFGWRKVRYRGIEKNLHQLNILAALTNIYLNRKRLLGAYCV